MKPNELNHEKSTALFVHDDGTMTFGKPIGLAVEGVKITPYGKANTWLIDWNVKKNKRIL